MRASLPKRRAWKPLGVAAPSGASRARPRWGRQSQQGPSAQYQVDDERARLHPLAMRQSRQCQLTVLPGSTVVAPCPRAKTRCPTASLLEPARWDCDCWLRQAKQQSCDPEVTLGRSWPSACRPRPVRQGSPRQKCPPSREAWPDLSGGRACQPLTRGAAWAVQDHGGAPMQPGQRWGAAVPGASLSLHRAAPCRGEQARAACLKQGGGSRRAQLAAGGGCGANFAWRRVVPRVRQPATVLPRDCGRPPRAEQHSAPKRRWEPPARPG
mmetsp:Transcript_12601/g.48379  ORF Transcript_12601/g.48379 Transcript_12601/m.48379 type:complete len:268 (+) Transcript_12601:635-1438(+)